MSVFFICVYLTRSSYINKIPDNFIVAVSSVAIESVWQCIIDALNRHYVHFGVFDILSNFYQYSKYFSLDGIHGSAFPTQYSLLLINLSAM